MLQTLKRIPRPSQRLCATVVACLIAGATSTSVLAQATGPTPSPGPAPKSAPGTPPAKAPTDKDKAPPKAAEAPGAKPGLRTAPLPKTPAEREKALSDLYALLATSDSEQSAKTVAEGIERIWHNSGSATVDLLMARALKAMNEKNYKLAIKLLDSIVDLAPDYAEAWNRRAYAHFANEDVQRALGDLRRTLALDGNHFKALEGLAQILREIGQKKAALQAMRKLIEVHPYASGAQQVIDELEREVEGQGI